MNCWFFFSLGNAGASLSSPWWPFCVWGVVSSEPGIRCTSTNIWQAGWNAGCGSVCFKVRLNHMPMNKSFHSENLVLRFRSLFYRILHHAQMPSVVIGKPICPTIRFLHPSACSSPLTEPESSMARRMVRSAFWTSLYGS